MQNVKELEKYRIGLFRDACSMTHKPDRTPNVSYMVTWKILDAGYKLTEALSDYDIMTKVVREHQDKYNFDGIIEMGVRNQYLISEYFGAGRYIVDDKTESVNFRDIPLCESEGLRIFADNPQKFMWEQGMGKMYSFWNKPNDVAFFQKAIEINNGFFKYAYAMADTMRNEYGLPTNVAPNPIAQTAIEFFFQTMRGIKGLSMDMRHDPGLLDAAIEAWNETFFNPQLTAMKAAKAGPSDAACFDSTNVLLAHIILNTKQWEKYYWKYLKQVLDVQRDKNWSVRFFAEDKISRFWDYLSEYPRGMLTIHPDNDDIFEARKKFPTFALMGGMKLSTLGMGSKQECLDLAKRLIDELGAEGGYVMCEDKMGSYRSDANAENLKAVCDFVREYRPSQN